MLLACSDGLLRYDGIWHRVNSPVHAPSLIACEGTAFTAVDNTAHILWHGKPLPCGRDIEALALWRGYALALSSDTDSLSIADKDGWMISARTGIYPQDMFVLQDSVLVCGGADGLVHQLSLPDLLPLGTLSVPGMPLRVHVQDSTAYILSAADEDDAELSTHLGQIDLQCGIYHPIAQLTGIPGAVHADTSGGIWAAAAERLYHFPANSTQPDTVFRGFGLVRHIDVRDNVALLTDPVAEICVTITQTPEPQIRILWRGSVEQAIFC